MSAAFFDLRDLRFILDKVCRVDALLARPLYAEHDRDSVNAVLDAAYALAESHFLPHAAQLDAQEPRFDGERVHILPAVKQALDAYVDAGFMSASFDAGHGGLQLPYAVSAAAQTIFTAANAATAGYPFLTIAAANLLGAFGTPEQQARYMQPMVQGRYFGTMCLSEPQAGSSLGDIRTRATPIEEGHYRIVGNKMWISGGEHELSENIIHLVLARIEGAPAGVKGLSLFAVPRLRIDAQGHSGARNGVRLAGLNHKMGYRGTVNCVLNFGEREDCIGELIGAPGQGLACMFHMMNEARIGVGMGAASLAMAGYRYALAYAQERRQGRAPGERDPAAAPVAIIEHADVRRMLLQQKCYAEGALALCLYCAALVDEQRSAADAALRDEAGLLLEILTPVAKAWSSTFGLKANELAIQVLGGYGYTRDYPLERLYRDNRLNPIHEGTNGIQALDLLGRKLRLHEGAGVRLLFARMRDTARVAAQQPALQEFAAALRAVITRVETLTAELSINPGRALPNASLYLEVTGHVVVAWIWLLQAERATQAEGDLLAGKRRACQYFFRHELPTVYSRIELLLAGDDTVAASCAEEF